MRHMEEVFIVVSPVSRSIAHRLWRDFRYRFVARNRSAPNVAPAAQLFNQFETELKVRPRGAMASRLEAKSTTAL
jgi:hypothetical protein